MPIISSGDVDITATLVDITGALTASGRIQVSNDTNAASTTDGSLQTNGGLSVAKDAIIGNDLKLLSDTAELSLGAGSDATLTHDGTTGLTIAANPISIDSADKLDLSSTTGFINFQDGGTNKLSINMDGTANEVIMKFIGFNDKFVFKTYNDTEAFRVENDGDFSIGGGYDPTGTTSGATIETDGNIKTTSSLTINNQIIVQGGYQSGRGITLNRQSNGEIELDGRIIVDNNANATSITDGSIQTDGGLSVTLDAVIGNDLSLLSDGAVLNFWSR